MVGLLTHICVTLRQWVKCVHGNNPAYLNNLFSQSILKYYLRYWFRLEQPQFHTLHTASGARLNIRKDVFSYNLVKSRSHEIGTINCRIALKFDRHIGSTAAEVPVKFQSDWTILNTNLAASILYEILRKDVFSDIETGPRSFRYFGSKSWNIMPRSVKNTKNINVFKKNITEWCHRRQCITCEVF